MSGLIPISARRSESVGKGAGRGTFKWANQKKDSQIFPNCVVVLNLNLNLCRVGNSGLR